jgi:RimJ/RimL family protein N-acetyltransferase
MKLTSNRTSLRLIDHSDIDFIHNLLSLPETDEFNALGIPATIEETKTLITPWIAENNQNEIKSYTFIIESKNEQSPIGLFGLKLGNKKYKRGEVWFKIHRESWNVGYATECLKAIINYGFETLDLHRIQAGCAVANIGSIKVLEKSGMTREGRGRQLLPLKSGWSDNFEYSILETDNR